MSAFPARSLALLLPTLLFLHACTSDGEVDPVTPEVDLPVELADWTEETHSNDVDPNLDEVFTDFEVQRLDLVVGSEQWQHMLDDMTELYGEMGASSGGPGGGPGGGLVEVDEDPVFVPAQLFYKNKQWYNIGLRFKGNSSLQSAWQAGILKLSFKLDFDEFEDTYPEIDNQRFYGIKKLSLKNNYDDKSLLREKVMADLFAEAGVAVSRTAFFEVYVDHGDGPEYFGVYTLVEEVNDSLIKTQFENNDGNLYKPDGDSASFAATSFNAATDEEVFEKKANEDEADFSDIEALFNALHDDTRLSDPEVWRANLDAVFDTNAYLKMLAVNTVAQNWDTYGRMTHNYYLYASPTTNKLTWIPWDNNEALQEGKRGGALAIDFSDLDDDAWPMISFLYADPVYQAQYDEHVETFIDGVFNVDTMTARYDAYAEMGQPFAAAERSGFSFLNGSADFIAAVASLKTHAQSRYDDAADYVERGDGAAAAD